MSLTEEDLIFIEDFRKEAKAAIRDVSPSWKQWSTNLLEDVKVRFLQQRASLLEEVASLKEQRLVLDNRRKTVEQQIKDVRRNLQAMGARDEVKRRKIDTQEVRRATPIGSIPGIHGRNSWTEECDKSLDEGGWLTDETINFAMERISESLPADTQLQIQGTFHMPIATQNPDQLERLCIEQFPKMTVIPIHATYLPLHSEPKDRNHWCVAVVSELDNEYHALYLDSLFSMKHFYSLVEFANSRGKTLRSAKVPDSPSQPNSSDCGIFTIHYVKIITENVQYFQDGMKGMFGLDKDKQRVIDWKAEKLKDARSELKKEIKQSITYRL